MSNALMEALSVGLPCVATDVGAARELFDEGEVGILVQSHSPGQIATALSRLCQNPDERQRLGRLAKERMKSKYSLVEMVRRYESYYVGHSGK